MLENLKNNRGRMALGIVLIGMGVLQLLTNGLGSALTTWVWIIALAAAAGAFTWVHRTEGQTWAAIGAYASGALAALIFIVTQLNASGNLVPTVVLLGIAAPFAWMWNRNRQQWGWLIPAYVLVVIVPILYIGDGPLDDTLIPAYVMGVIGAPFVAAGVLRQQWPLLIPGGILWVIGAFFLVDAIEALSVAMGVFLPIILIAIGAVMLFGDRLGIHLGGSKPKREG
jgi:hypothetical protein